MNRVVFEDVKQISSFDFWNDLTKTIIFDNFTKTFDPVTKQVRYPIIAFNTEMTYGSRITTNVGRFIFNKFCLPPIYETKFGYENVVIDKGNYFRITDNVTSLLLSGDITDKEYSEIVDRVNWLGNVTSNISGEGFDSKSFVLSPEVKIMRQEFLSSSDSQLTDPEYVNTWQKKIINEVKRTMSDRSIIKIINSGSKGDMDNNYKNMALFRGIVDGKFIPDNLVDGNSYDSYIRLGSNSVKGSSSRAIKTAMGEIGIPPLVWRQAMRKFCELLVNPKSLTSYNMV